MSQLCAHAQVGLKTGNARHHRGEHWTVGCALVVVLLGSLALGLWTQYTAIRQDLPADQDLAAKFFAEEKSFDELVSVLDADNKVLARTRTSALDLAALETVLGHGRMKQYVAILNRIEVVDLRYFPALGKLFLLPKGASGDIGGGAKTYLHLSTGRPEPLAQHHGYRIRGPGIYLLTGDRPLRQSWFIHHEATINVSYAPY